MKKIGLLTKGVAKVMSFAMAACLLISSAAPVEAATEGTLIFSGGTNESYESENASWLLNAADTDVITVKYTCTDATHGGWGVLGWGATVNGNWTEGPAHMASEANATDTVTETMTAATLKKKLGITASSDVSYIKLGAWNGGKIEALTISGAGASSVVADTTVKEEEVEETLPPLTGDYLYLLDSAQNLTIWPDLYLDYWVPGQTIYVTMEVESNGAFGGGLGASVNGWGWLKEEFGSENGETITIKWFLTPIANNIQFQLWWMNGSQVGIKSIKVEKAIDYNVYDDFVVEGGNDSAARDPYAGNANASNSGYVDMTGNGWTEKELSLAELLGGVDPATVTSIVFNGETDFIIGYNNTAGGWTQPENGSVSYTVTDLDLSNFFAKICLNKYNGNLYRMTWDVYTNGATPSTGSDAGSDSSAEAVHTGYVDMAADGWQQEAISYTDLIGDVDPASITSIEFSGDVPFQVGYNTTSGWTQHDDVMSYAATDIDLNTSNYYVQLGTNGTGRFTWKVFTN